MTQEEKDNSRYYSEPDKATLTFFDFQENPEYSVFVDQLIFEDYKFFNLSLSLALEDRANTDAIQRAQSALAAYKLALSRFKKLDLIEKKYARYKKANKKVSGKSI